MIGAKMIETIRSAGNLSFSYVTRFTQPLQISIYGSPADIGMLFEVYFFGASPVFETREEAQLIAEILEKKHHPKRKSKESQIVMILSDHPFPEIDVKEATSILEEYLN